MRYLCRALLLAIALPLWADHAAGQDVELVQRQLLEEVMPGADRFDPADGDPPVKRAYRGDELLGYVFITSDFPPEEYGYSGPIRALVGMRLDGVLTGMRVTEYRESRMYDWGDFLREPPWFQQQFTGKDVGDRFRVRGDIDGISQVTITVRALAKGVRDAARRVAAAYEGNVSLPLAVVPEAELSNMSWYAMRRRGVAATMVVTAEGRGPVRISLIHLPTEDFARHLLGNLSRNIAPAVRERGGADVQLLYSVEGSGPWLAVREGWSIEQGGTTVAIPTDDVVALGSPGGGLLFGETTMVGVMLLDADQADISAPLTFVFDGGRTDLGPFRVEYTSQAALTRMAEAARVAEAEAPPPEAAREVPSAPPEQPEEEEAVDADAAVAAAPVPAPDPPAPAPAVAAPEPTARFDQASVEDDYEYEGVLGSVTWSRVGWITLVLVLASLAFFTKREGLRWASLATTLVVLGWIDGGFLSISHITGLIWVGPSAIMSDLPLLMMVVFTLFTVLLWGRVFCGFLCPFGALQDVIDRVVPARFKRELPKGLHRMALKSKYVILAIILIPALAGAQVSLYQYFEPFGTVFFVSRSLLLWAIAGSFLVAAAIVPRFYCRYACPLGAALAVGSLLSLRRIKRIEQCDYCKVCEQKCPTGAIEGPAVDFKECVRCNVCEIQLIERTGVCGHDMEEIRPRLIQIASRDSAKKRSEWAASAHPTS